MLELLGIEHLGHVVVVYVGEGHEVLLVFVLRHDRNQLGHFPRVAHKDLALAVLDVFLDIAGHGFRNAEVFHVFGKRYAHFLAKREEIVDGVAGIEDDGRVVEDLYLLSAKLLGGKTFYLDEGVEGELDIVLGFNFEVG